MLTFLLPTAGTLKFYIKIVENQVIRVVVAEPENYTKLMQRCKLNEAKVIVVELCQLLKTHVHMRHANSDVHNRLRQLLSRLLPCIIVLRSYEIIPVKIKLYEMVASVIQNVLHGTQDTITKESTQHEELSASTTNSNSLVSISNGCNKRQHPKNNNKVINNNLLYSNDNLQAYTKAKQSMCECTSVNLESEEVESNVTGHTNLCNTLTESEQHVHCPSKCEPGRVSCANEAHTCSGVEEWVRWADVDGCEDAIAAIKQATIIPRRFPVFFHHNRQPWRRILLYGPPGTGKTLIARATACELNIPFLHFSSVDILSKWVGNSEKQLREVFIRAAQLKQCVLFFDEIDALCGARGASGESELARRLKTEFLLHLQTTPSEVVILAATNLPWEIDSAICRRFDRFLYVGLPSSHTRRKLIHRYLEGIFNTLTSHDMEWIISETEHFSASDVIHLVQHAVMCPVSILIGANALREATLKEIREYTIEFKSCASCKQNTLGASPELVAATTTKTTKVNEKCNKGRNNWSSSTTMSDQSSTASVLSCKSGEYNEAAGKSSKKKLSEHHVALKNDVTHVKETSHPNNSSRRKSISTKLYTHYVCHKSDKSAHCKLTTDNANNTSLNMKTTLNKESCSVTTNASSKSLTNAHKSKRIRTVVLNLPNTIHEKRACKEQMEENNNAESVAGYVQHSNGDNDGDDADSDVRSAAHCCDDKCNCKFSLLCEEREIMKEECLEHCCDKIPETNLTSYSLQQSRPKSVISHIDVDEKVKIIKTNIISQTYYVPCNKEDDINALPGLTFNDVAMELILLPPVTRSDFVKAFEAIIPSVTLKEMERYSQWQKRKE